MAPTTVVSSTTNTNNQSSLSFSRATFAKLSPRPFLLAHLQPSTPSGPLLRPNGRTLHQFRSPAIHTGSLTHADGSAVVRLGDTAVVCGVRGEMLLARDVPAYVGEDGGRQHQQQESPGNFQDLGLFVPNVELATGCSPAHLPGQPPSALAQTLAARILFLLRSSKVVKEEDLHIWHRPVGRSDDDEDDHDASKAELKAFWTLYIDVWFISLDGNPFDAAWAAVLLALRDVRIPYAYWDVDREMILCEDSVSKARKLVIHGAPIPSSFAIFTAPHAGKPRGSRQESNSWILADPNAFEEDLCGEVITVTVDCSTSAKPWMLKVEKRGGGIVGKDQMRDIIRLAQARWTEWQEFLQPGTVMSM